MEVNNLTTNNSEKVISPSLQQHGRKRPFEHNPNMTRGNSQGRGGGRSRSRRRRPNNSNNKKNSPQIISKKKPGCSVCNQEIANYKCPKCRVTYCSVACCQIHKEKSCNAQQKENEESSKATTTTSSSSKRKSKYLTPNVCTSDLLIEDPIEMQQQRRIQLAEEDEEDLEEEGLKITQSMMDTMDHSQWLQKELQDGGLRHIIHQILMGGTGGSNATTTISDNHNRNSNQHITTTLQQQEEALMNAKSNYPNFATFIDKLLVVTGIFQREQDNDGVNATNSNYHAIADSEYPFETMEEWLENATPEDNTLGHLMLAPTLQQEQRELMAAEHLKDQEAKNKKAKEESNTTSGSSSHSDSSSEDDDSSATSSSDSDDDTTSSSDED